MDENNNKTEKGIVGLKKSGMTLKKKKSSKKKNRKSTIQKKKEQEIATNTVFTERIDNNDRLAMLNMNLEFTVDKQIKSMYLKLRNLRY